MYSFEPTEEQKMLIDSIHRYAANDLRVAAHEADETGNLPVKLVQKGWELGFIQASIPESYGGFGERSIVCGALAAEEIAWGDLGGALCVMTPALFAFPILACGSESQKQAYLPAIAEGDWRPYTAALIEPTFDFNPVDLRAVAREEGDEYVISGQKVFVPYAHNAEAMILYANLDGKTQGFIIPKDAAGLEVGGRQKLMGIHALPVFSVSCHDVRVPKDNRLGGSAGHDFAPILDAQRLALSAMAVGVARAALEYSSNYAKEREVFGVKVAQKQAIAFMIAEMATEIEATRLLVWEAAWMMDTGKLESSKEAYLSLNSAMDMAMMVTDRAVQILGGHGYIREHPVELWMRNGRGIAALNGLAMV